MSRLPQPLVDVAWLGEHLSTTGLRIVDCRFDLGDPPAGRMMHIERHIPGASYFSLDDDLSAAQGPGRHPLPGPAAFAATLGAAGIGNDDAVVAYDSAGGAFASRLWWMLRSLGHGQVAVLDGGWQAWRVAGGPIDKGPVSAPATSYAAPSEWSGTVDRLELEERLGSVDLVDARAAERYRGESEPIDPVAGHIPTARNLPWAGNLGEDGRFLDVERLAERFSGTGPDAIFYCGSGVTACHNLLAMEAAAIGTASLYAGSWSDWCSSGGEIA